MRYIGSKLKLITYIVNTVKKYCGEDLSQKTFCDLFAGTSVVAKTFSPLVKSVIANDLEYYSKLSASVYLKGFNYKNVASVIDKINTIDGDPNGKIAQEYSEGGYAGRLFFSKENGAKISAARDYIESIDLSENDKNAVILSILDASDSVANCTGVYGAFLKELKDAAKKEVVFKVPELNESAVHEDNVVFQGDANLLIKEISGDILYLDPPYNTRQYSSNYHILNYIAENKIEPTMSKAGLREHNKSKYSSKSSAEAEFEQLIQNAKFEWIFLSYNDEGIIPISRIRAIMSKYGDYFVEERIHQRYKSDSKRKNLAGKDTTVEYVHVLHKNLKNKKSSKKQEEKHITSPMNYMGGKKDLLSRILPYFPSDIDTFVDLFCGGCTVGINANAKKVVFNDAIGQMIKLYQNILVRDTENLVSYVDSVINAYGINRYDKEAYNAFREKYNLDEFHDMIDLFILVAFGFNNQIRFNRKGEFNIPFGVNRSGWNNKMKQNFINFANALKERDISFQNCDFREFNYDSLTKDDFVYVDPPYLISMATYNSAWREKEEEELLDILLSLDKRGIRFALSNVFENKNAENTILKNWCKKNKFKVVHLLADYSNSSYHRKEKESITDEVLVTNY